MSIIRNFTLEVVAFFLLTVCVAAADIAPVNETINLSFLPTGEVMKATGSPEDTVTVVTTSDSGKISLKKSTPGTGNATLKVCIDGEPKDAASTTGTWIGVKNVSAGTVTSTTSTPGADETLLVPVGDSNSNITITATPDGGTVWPAGYPKWTVNGTSAGTAGSATYSLSKSTAGTYTVSASCGTSEKTIKITIIEIKYIRLVDAARNANRSTRAVNTIERKSKEYEDNPRSDVDYRDDLPLLRLPTNSSSNKATVLISIGTVPDDVSDKVLWKIGNQTGTVAMPSVILDPGPASHHASTRDYVMEVGIDLNDNGTIDTNEKISLTYGINVIGNSEYQTAYSNANAWYLRLAGGLYPWAAAFMSQFKDGTTLNSYASATNVSLNYGLNTYDQKNGFGCASPTISSGTIKRFEFPNTSNLTSKVLKSSFISSLLREVIVPKQIGEWYQDNPSISFKIFVASGQKQGSFSEDDLKNAFGGMTVNYSIGISTEKNSAGVINVTGIAFTGYVYDLYDWKSGAAEELYGCPILQTTYNPSNGRSQGAIFESKVNLQNNVVNLSVEHSNLEEIIDEFRDNI